MITLETAQSLLKLGLPFGTVYVQCRPEDGEELKKVYVGDPTLPNLRDRPRILAKREEPTGDVCSVCGSSRMTQAGACKVCLDCGTSGGCG